MVEDLEDGQVQQMLQSNTHSSSQKHSEVQEQLTEPRREFLMTDVLLANRDLYKLIGHDPDRSKDNILTLQRADTMPLRRAESMPLQRASTCNLTLLQRADTD